MLEIFINNAWLYLELHCAMLTALLLYKIQIYDWQGHYVNYKQIGLKIKILSFFKIFPWISTISLSLGASIRSRTTPYGQNIRIFKSYYSAFLERCG